MEKLKYWVNQSKVINILIRIDKSETQLKSLLLKISHLELAVAKLMTETAFLKTLINRDIQYLKEKVVEIELNHLTSLV